MAKLVSQTYSEALFELAGELNKTDEMYEEVVFAKEAFVLNPDLIKFLSHPKIGKEEKLQTIENIFKGRVSDELTGFLVLMVQKDHSEDLIPVFDEFIKMVKELRKIGIATVVSATELNASLKSQIEKKLLAQTAYESFEMNYSVDESLLGGMVIRIGDRVVDASLKQKLESMTKELKKVRN